MNSAAEAARERHAAWHARREGFKARCYRWRHSMRHSLKWRLVIAFLLPPLAVTGVFLFGMKRVVQTGWQGYAKPIVADYVDKLAAEIGSPPDVAKAQAIVARLPVTVSIEGPSVQFNSHPDLRRRWGSYGGDY